VPSRHLPRGDSVLAAIADADEHLQAIFELDLACRTAGYFVDYRKARHFFVAHGQFYAAYYYIADYTAAGDAGTRDLVRLGGS
jgi:hypothetical protein